MRETLLNGWRRLRESARSASALAARAWNGVERLLKLIGVVGGAVAGLKVLLPYVYWVLERLLGA
jgi:hypothetical protein